MTENALQLPSPVNHNLSNASGVLKSFLIIFKAIIFLMKDLRVMITETLKIQPPSLNKGHFGAPYPRLSKTKFPCKTTGFWRNNLISFQNGKTKCRRPQCPKGQCRNSIDGASTSCCVPCSGKQIESLALFVTVIRSRGNVLQTCLTENLLFRADVSYLFWLFTWQGNGFQLRVQFTKTN